MPERSDVEIKKEEIIEGYLGKTTIRDRNGDLTGVKEMFEFLFKDDIVCKMIEASKKELPVLSFVLDDIEKEFGGKDSPFPIVIRKDEDVKRYKRAVGKMAKIIMACFGYEKRKDKHPEAVAIPRIYIYRERNSENVKSFSHSSVYYEDGIGIFGIANRKIQFITR